MTVALGTLIPTSITVVETKTSISLDALGERQPVHDRHAFRASDRRLVSEVWREGRGWRKWILAFGLHPDQGDAHAAASRPPQGALGSG